MARALAIGRRLFPALLLPVCALFLLSNLLPARAAEPPRLIEIEGIVELRHGANATWTPAKVGDTLAPGDIVKTGPRSRAALRLGDSSVIRKGELTTLQFSPPKPGSDKPVLDLIGGLLYFFSREKKDESQIHVPGASGAVRGTEFTVSVNTNGASVFTMIDGVVDLENEHGSQPLHSGQEGEVAPGSAPKFAPRVQTVTINVKLYATEWCWYYPAILDLDELDFKSDRLADAITLYRSGDIPKASAAWPTNYEPSNEKEKIFFAALSFAAGSFPSAFKALKGLDDSPLATAVKMPARLTDENQLKLSKTASGLLAKSYAEQGDGLAQALHDARAATARSPNFGFAWARVAELEFSFGRIELAREAAEKALQLTPRNAEARSLLGFLAAAHSHYADAIGHFNQAIEIDGALGNAWLGRGLVKIHEGRMKEGLEDLQTAVVVEPNRAVLRSYLAKAAANAGNLPQASKEISIALEFDQNDPTSWFYNALIDAQKNEFNDAIESLEKSKEANNNRALYRSQLLLDQDQAVRRANLAGIYRDAGMTEVSVREAARAVQDDYANSSAHLFLASSYDSLRDARQTNLRYDTAWFSELLLADLLAPPGVGALSPTISQQEYSRLFAQDGLHFASGTEYQSSGRWLQYGSQSGVFGDSSYSFDTVYSSLDADHANSDFEQVTVYGRFKQAISPHDTLFIMANYYDAHAGDARAVYNPNDPTLFGASLRIHESQEPNVFAGFRHEWQPGANTLLLAGRLDDHVRATDADARLALLTLNPDDSIFRGRFSSFTNNYSSLIDVWIAEAQHIQQFGENRLIAGARYQSGRTTTSTFSDRAPFGAGTPEIRTNLNVTSDLDRATAYAYVHLQPIDQLSLIGGATYDRLVYPEAIGAAPIIASEHTTETVSPQAGFIFKFTPETILRGAYTRSLGGAFNDSTVRLEPVQTAGFINSFRSGPAESVAGQWPGARFENWNISLEHEFPHHIYAGIDGAILNSHGNRGFGAFTLPNRIPFVPEPAEIAFYRQYEGYRERSAGATVNELLGQNWSLGARYRITESKLDIATPAIAQAVFPTAYASDETVLHHFQPFAIFNHGSGFFSSADANLYSQSTTVYAPGRDTFWQFNLYAGWRFPNRRAEITLGILNLSDRDYRLDPLSLAPDLPRSRTFVARLKFAF